MPTVFINGKKTNVPSSATPEDFFVRPVPRAKPSTRAVINTSTAKNTRMKQGQQYQINQYTERQRDVVIRVFEDNIAPVIYEDEESVAERNLSCNICDI